MNKAALYEILITNGVEVDKNITKDELIALILAKGFSVPPDANGDQSQGDNKPDDGNDTSENKNDTEGEKDSESKEDGKDDDADADSAAADEVAWDDKLPKFSKAQLMKSSTYSHRRDILNALLKDDKTYSHYDVGVLLKKFFEKKVK